MCNACGRAFTDKSTLRRHTSVSQAGPGVLLPAAQPWMAECPSSCPGALRPGGGGLVLAESILTGTAVKTGLMGEGCQAQ